MRALSVDFEVTLLTGGYIGFVSNGRRRLQWTTDIKSYRPYDQSNSVVSADWRRVDDVMFGPMAQAMQTGRIY